MADEDDAELVQEARAGSARALEVLIDRHQARVFRFGMQMCRDRDDAEDVLQDTLLAMVKGLRDFRGASSLSTWLYSIARGYCVKKRRRSKSAPRAVRSLHAEAAHEATQVADPARGPDEILHAKRLESALEQAIAGLEPMYREVLVLRDVEGLTAPEVAQVLGIGVGAVKSRLHRARLRLRDRLAPLLEAPAGGAPAGAGAGPAAAAPASPTPGGPARAARARCPDVLQLFSKHLEDDIGPEVCAAMEQHLDACPRCRVACDSLRRTVALCRAAPEAQVPAAIRDTIRAAIRDGLAPRA